MSQSRERKLRQERRAQELDRLFTPAPTENSDLIEIGMAKLSPKQQEFLKSGEIEPVLDTQVFLEALDRIDYPETPDTMLYVVTDKDGNKAGVINKPVRSGAKYLEWLRKTIFGPETAA